MNFYFIVIRVAVILAVAKHNEARRLDVDKSHIKWVCNDMIHKRNPVLAFNDKGFTNITVPNNTRIIDRSGIDIESSFLVSFNDSEASSNFEEELPAKPFEEDDQYDNVTVFQTYLNLEGSQLFNLSAESFESLSEVDCRFLNMRFSNIVMVSEDTLKPIQNSLMVLDLADATIWDKDLRALMQGLLNETSILQVLSLANLGLRDFPFDAIALVRFSLKALSLFGNNFAKGFHPSEGVLDIGLENTDDLLEFDDYDVSGFPLMTQLLELDLRNCRIDFIKTKTFKRLAKLNKLYLSHNNIIILKAGTFLGLKNLELLDISYNAYYMGGVVFGLFLQQDSFAGLYSLKELNFCNTVFHGMSRKFLSDLPSSLASLDVCGSGLTYLMSGLFAKLTNLRMLDISFNLGLGRSLSMNAFQGLDILQELYVAGIALPTFEPLKKLTMLKCLFVNENNIDNLSGALANFPFLEHLEASSNYITSWRAERAFAHNLRLKTVHLHNNVLTLMSSAMMEDFKSLTSLTLGNNNFICNCQLRDFMLYLLTMNNQTNENLPLLSDYQLNGKVYVCADVTLSQFPQFTDVDKFCLDELARNRPDALIHGIYISALVFVCSLSLGVLIYRQWWYIRYFTVLIKNATVMSVMNVKNCEDIIYRYDIFVSYADRNRAWVIEELLPNLEAPDTNFSICLHERDFKVGVGILENIIMGMDESRTILLIISGCFVKSQWCQFEMHLAQHRLLETCREELVLVLLEEIPRKKRPKTLHYLMMVKTYIVWPSNSDDHNAKKLFWKRLRRAITANRSKQFSHA